MIDDAITNKRTGSRWVQILIVVFLLAVVVVFFTPYFMHHG